jgi:cell wall-associated NlpC family hydrolase
MTREEIVAEARRYVALGTPWRHRGRSATGCDCIGLIMLVGRAQGVYYEDIDGYSRNPDGRFLAHLRKFLVYPMPQTLKHGSIVVLREAQHPCHIGIIAMKGDKPWLIHSSIRRHKVVEEPYDETWRQRFRCVLEMPGVED